MYMYMLLVEEGQAPVFDRKLKELHAEIGKKVPGTRTPIEPGALSGDAVAVLSALGKQMGKCVGVMLEDAAAEAPRPEM